jgi:carbonic anhydrase
MTHEPASPEAPTSPNAMLWNRRRFLAAGAALGAGVWATVRAQSAPRPIAEAPMSGEEALRRLLEGNRRFVRGKPLHAHEAARWRQRLSRQQKPIAAVLGCSDSRVPPELLFDQGFGDLFIIRVAGNVVSTDVVGSLQYAGAHLHVPLLIVLGHEGCGAVSAALEAVRGKAHEPRYIEALTRLIQPGIAGVDAGLPWEKQVNAAVKANVRWSMKQLGEIPEAKAALETKRIKMVGGIYDLDTGQVALLDR